MTRKSIIVILTLAAVGTGALWLLSYVVDPDNMVWSWEGEDAFGKLAVVGGRLAIVLAHKCEDISANNPSFRYEFAGFEITRVVGLQDISGMIWFVFLPLWLIFPILVAYPAIAFIRGPLRRWRRPRKGLCRNCGYNLRGLTEPRCPECATAFDPKLLAARSSLDATDSTLRGE